MVMHLQSKLELSAAPTPDPSEPEEMGRSSAGIWTIRSWTENILGSQCQDPAPNLSCIIRLLYSDRRYHLEQNLISLILAVPQTEDITARLHVFISNFPTIDHLLFSKTTAPLWKDVSASLWSVQEEPHAHITKKTISDIYETTQKATRDWSTF